MINKFYKIINNRFSRFFKFIFFIRYLFLIFLVTIVLFLTIPQLFDYGKNEETIKNYIKQHYGLEIVKMEDIKYKFFPVPHLTIQNPTLNFYSKGIKFKTKNMIIYPKLFSIYNYENFYLKKVILDENNLEIDFKNIKFFSNYIFQLEKKFFFKDLNLKIKDKDKIITNLNKINFLNYGYKKNIIEGEIFNKKFRIKLGDNFSQFDFKIYDTGISASLEVLEKKQNSKLAGILKGKILKSDFKMNFTSNDEKIEVVNFFFRDKDLSFDTKGKIEFQPFFRTELSTEIKNINLNLINNIDLSNLLKSKELIKRINSQNLIFFNYSKFNRNLVKDFSINTDLAYGRLISLKKFSISNSDFTCQNNVNLLEEYPLLYFDCSINSPDKKELLKKIKIKYKNKNESLKLKIKGDLNILNNKINLSLIETNDRYKATDEDLKYFKTIFEKILLDENFIGMFNLSKIRKYVLEIS